MDVRLDAPAEAPRPGAIIADGAAGQAVSAGCREHRALPAAPGHVLAVVALLRHHRGMDAMECDGCGATMRWETSHSRCDRCGYIRPCCEGAPVTAACVVPAAGAGARAGADPQD